MAARAFLLLVFLQLALLPYQARALPQEYLRAQTAELASNCLSEVHDLSAWQHARPELQRKAAEMLGLDPMPPKTELHPVITGGYVKSDFSVVKLYFQSEPHLYMTANLYLPRGTTNKIPAILYLCGHSEVASNGISYGNKVAYQQHGIWFARNGYACLVVDTLQYGEIEGHHRGTYSEGAWWWNSRGYSPAGVETWNAIRALDYLASRPEVDTNRIGVTGRSGGGAYSWFVAALDDRIKVIAPIAGMTDLENYVVDGAVDQHCDCMFPVNTYRWDLPTLSALCAPRPLLMENSDADSLFPLDGVIRVHDKVKRIYGLYGKATNFGLVITPGPHKDTQDLQLPVFRWFNHYLKHDDSVVEMAATKQFAPEELRVFTHLPTDQINTRIEETFVPEAKTVPIPKSVEKWNALKKQWMTDLREKCFAGWPSNSSPTLSSPFNTRTNDGMVLETYKFKTQPGVNLFLGLLRSNDISSASNIILQVNFNADRMEEDPQEPLAPGIVAVLFYPRNASAGLKPMKGHELISHRRRLMLLGQTLAGMQVWDIVQAVRALKNDPRLKHIPLTIETDGDMAINTLYASLFVDGVQRIRLNDIPSDPHTGPDYLNVQKYITLPEVVAMAAERTHLELSITNKNDWVFPLKMTEAGFGHTMVTVIQR